MEGEGCYVRSAPTVTISACVRAKLLLGWLFQFRSIYLTILFCTVCDWLKISGHFIEQPSLKPGNSSVFFANWKPWDTKSKLEGQFSCSSKFLGFLHMAFHLLNSVWASQTFFARTRARRTLKRKCGIFEQAIKYKTKWEKNAWFPNKPGKCSEQGYKLWVLLSTPCNKKKFLLINTYGACVLVVYSLNSVSWIVKNGL